jgi:hypothetical protein
MVGIFPPRGWLKRVENSAISASAGLRSQCRLRETTTTQGQAPAEKACKEIISHTRSLWDEPARIHQSSG